jgi:hypothetical protein
MVLHGFIGIIMGSCWKMGYSMVISWDERWEKWRK